MMINSSDRYVICGRIQDLKYIEWPSSQENFDAVLSVRVMPYLSLFQVITMLKNVSNIAPLFIGYEDYVGSVKLRIGRIFFRKLQVLVLESLN